MRGLTLWDDLPAEVQSALLRRASAKLNNPQRAKRKIERILSDEQEARRPRVLSNLKSVQVYYLEEEGRNLANISDGWLRVVALDKLGSLHIYLLERIKRGYLKELSPTLKQWLPATKWPRPRGKNPAPFRNPYLYKCDALPITKDEETRQYKVTFDEGEATSLTFYFPLVLDVSILGEGWVKVSKLGRGVPFKN